MSATVRSLPTGTWVADPVHSTVNFSVRHAGLSAFRGGFENFEARLDGGDNGDPRLVGSVKAEDIVVKLADLKGHLLSDEFFAVDKHPAITFHTTNLRLAEDGTLEADGELTIKGITCPVTARGVFTGPLPGPGGGRMAGIELETTIDRRNFDMNWQMDLPNGRRALEYDVTLSVQVELTEQA